MKYIKILVFLIISFSAYSQKENNWSVLIKEKNKEYIHRDDMSSYSKTGFFLYKNCIYDYVLKNRNKHEGRLINIEPDSLCFANYSFVAYNENDIFDTLKIHYNQIDKLLLVKDWSGPTYKKIPLANFEFVFIEDTVRFEIESIYGYTFLANESDNELIPRLTKDGVKYFFEYKGKFYGHRIDTVHYEPNFIQKHIYVDPATKTIYVQFKSKD
jgi:hypothetical protein